MSIIKNDRTAYHTDQTIRVFPADARIPSPISGDNYGSCEYIDLNKKYITSGYLWAPGAGEAVFIRCYVNTAASGQIYGTTEANYGLRIVQSTTTFTWYIGTTSLGSKTLSNGEHILGFLCVDEGTTRKSQPFCDGAAFGTKTDATAHLNYVSIGGNATSNISASSGYGIRIYEVLARSYTSNTSANARAWFHLYAAQDTSTSSNIGMYETRRSLRFITPTGSASGATAAVGSRVKYGVQLFDLKDVFQSSYHDLVAIVADDGGVASESGWGPVGTGTANADSPYVITENNVAHNFAFCLKNAPTPGTKSGPTAYANGEILRGRKPKWSIWNDAIKFGKYGTQASSSSRIYYWFNIFKELSGADAPVRLENFKDYDTSKNYPPSFNVDLESSVTVEWHNGVVCTLAAANTFVGTNAVDERRVFGYSRASGGSCSFCLGNLPLLNIPEASQPSLLKCKGGGLIAVSASQVLATYFKTNSSFLSSDLAASTIEEFKTQTINATSTLRNITEDWLRYSLEQGAAPEVTFSMALTKTTSIDPAEQEIIDCSSVVPKKTSTLNGNFDNRVKTYASSTLYKEGDRIVVGEEGGIATVENTNYTINIPSTSVSDYAPLYDYVCNNGNQTVEYGHVFGMAFCLRYGAREPKTLFDGNHVPNVLCYAEFTASEIAHTTGGTSYPVAIKGRYYGFALPINFKAYSMYEDLGYNKPFSYMRDIGWYSNSCYPNTWNQVGANQVGAALFLWSELEGSLTQRPNYPITVRMRVYQEDEAPIAWDLYPSLTSNKGFDTTAECYYITKTFRYMFHTHDRLIPFDGDKNLYLDAIVTVWNGTSQVTNLATAFNSKSIKLYSREVHEPKDKDSFPFVAGPTFVVSSIGSTATHKEVTDSSGNWQLILDATYDNDFIRVPSGTPGFHKQVFRIQITGPRKYPTTGYTTNVGGTMYYIDIT